MKHNVALDAFALHMKALATTDRRNPVQIVKGEIRPIDK